MADVECQVEYPNERCDALEEAVGCLRAGGVVAFPTDTLYGLGADVFCVPALRRIFDIKGRPAQLAVPVLVAEWGQVRLVARRVPDLGRRLAQRFWPGPLTLVLPRAPEVPDLLTGGRDTIAVRMPDHRVPRYLAGVLGHPITGTSANRSGEPDLLTLEAVEAGIGRLVDRVIGCGPDPQGVASTVVDVTADAPRLLRQGAVPFEEILSACA